MIKNRSSSIFFLITLSFLLLFTLLTPTSAYGEDENSYKKPIEVTETEKGVRVETELANYLFYKQGANIRSIFLHFASYGSKQAELISGTTTDPKTLNRSFMEQATFPGQLELNGNSDTGLNYEVEIPQGTFYDQIELKFTAERDGYEIIKTYTVRNTSNYTLEMDLSLKNIGDQTVSFQEKDRLTVGSVIQREDQGNVQHITDAEVKHIFDGEASGGILAEGQYVDYGGSGYVGSDLVLFFKHGTIDGETNGKSKLSPEFSNNTLYIDLGKAELGPNESTEYQFTIYGGRRRHVLLSNVGLAAIDKIGIFSKLLVPIINLLHRLYKFTGNYAWAIIIFTILIRVILYPLMRNMYHSMAKMQELQPKLQEIKEEYDDDRQKQQEAMMELYREEGVNPMGGCLPMFIQLPILILLWRAILYSAEQIHLSPGFLWLNDLSLHDPFYILVALTVGIMIVQQQLMQRPGGGGGQNKWLGLVFPLFMGIMLHNFPAGLWLYYFLTTLFQVGQQYFINWEMEKAEAET